MIGMTGNRNDIAETGRRRLIIVAVVVFRNKLRRVLKVGSGIPLLIVFFRVSLPLGLVIKL